LFEGFKNRRPWAAVFITFFLTPVTGMAFLNRGKAALAYFSVYAILIAVGLASLPKGVPFWIQIASFIISICAIVHTVVIARRRDPSEPLRWYSRRWYVLAIIYPGLILILLGVRAYLYQPFNIPSASMEPAANPGDYFLVSKFSYDVSSPERGDLVVFYAPQFRSYFIKRVVGLPGDRVQIVHGRLVLNGSAVQTRRIADFRGVPAYEEVYPGGKVGQVLDQSSNGPEDDTLPFAVPDNSYFVLGDNRDNSDDSRGSIGYVPRDAIVGKAAIKYIADGHWVWRPLD
jgi:signal peptidase I